MNRRTPHPLRPADLTNIADIYQALADEYRAGHAAQAQATIANEIEAGYPATTSGAGGNGGGSDTSSRPEALTVRPDRTATEAAALADLQHKTAAAAATILRGLRARNPNRDIRSCPRCNHPIADGHNRCNRMIDGRRCGVCANTGNGCPREGTPLEAGEKMRNGLCNTCDIRHRRKEKTEAAAPRRTGAVASVANLVDGMTDIEVAD